MGRWRQCLTCNGTGEVNNRRRCPGCQGVGQVAPPDPQSARERRLASDHPHDPPHTGCPACVAEDPIGTLP